MTSGLVLAVGLLLNIVAIILLIFVSILAGVICGIVGATVISIALVMAARESWKSEGLNDLL
jgi:hypothetical protein